MEIKTHKVTGQFFEVKREEKGVSILYLLNENNQRINNGCNVYGKTSYKTAICLTKNLK